MIQRQQLCNAQSDFGEFLGESLLTILLLPNVQECARVSMYCSCSRSEKLRETMLLVSRKIGVIGLL